jgi:hypothetical protein
MLARCDFVSSWWCAAARTRQPDRRSRAAGRELIKLKPLTGKCFPHAQWRNRGQTTGLAQRIFCSLPQVPREELYTPSYFKCLFILNPFPAASAREGSTASLFPKGAKQLFRFRPFSGCRCAWRGKALARRDKKTRTAAVSDCGVCCFYLSYLHGVTSGGVN